jgi:hypothetical protein
MMQTTVHIENKPLTVYLSKAAQAAMRTRDVPLVAEMELYFSCLIRTRVRFYENGKSSDAVPVNEHLNVRFRPVMTKQCGRDYDGDEPPLTDFPISNSQAFIPKWLSIDFEHNQWTGEFGFTTRE